MKLTRAQLKRMKIVLMGGEGSGNFDHAGRLGKVGGSQPKSGSGTNELFYERLKRFEDKSRKSKDREIGSVISRDGNLISVKTGNKDAVEWTQSEIDRMGGAVLTHNHPSSWPFSQDDLRFAEYAKLYEIRAVGDKYIYSIINEDWENPKDVYRLHFDAAVRAILPKQKEFAEKEFNHAVLTEYAKRAGLKYRRIEYNA